MVSSHFFRLKPIVILSITCLLLGACSNQQTHTPSHTAINISSVIPSPYNPENSSTPRLTASIAPSPTTTQLPSPTSTINPHPSLDPEELATKAEITADIATYEAIRATELAIFPHCGPPERISHSPDGKWVAVECLNYETGVYNLDDPSKVWLLPYGKTLGLEIENRTIMGSLKIKHWSSDGRYLYLSPVPCCRDGGCVDYFEGIALLRLDLITGKVSQTLKLGKDSQFYNYSFSPNDTYLAYIRTWLDHPIINIRNMQTGEEQQIPIDGPYSKVGDIVWSPSNSEIIFSTRTGESCENLHYFLVEMEMTDHIQKVLINGSTSHYRPTEWMKNNMIILQEGYADYYYSFNPSTLIINPFLRPTPIPASQLQSSIRDSNP
jgi:hypothetical protein